MRQRHPKPWKGTFPHFRFFCGYEARWGQPPEDAGQGPLCPAEQLRTAASSACKAFTACCADCAQRSDFNIISEAFSFPVSIGYYSGIQAQVKKNGKIHCLPDASAGEGRETQPPGLGSLQALTADRPDQQILAGICASIH